MAVMLKKIERPRELKWYQAGAMLYGDWGTSKAYVIGIAFALAGHASWMILGMMSVLLAMIGVCYMVICRVYPDGGGVYSSVKHRSQTLAVIGALLLVADYVVTAALSIVDAFHYFGVQHPILWAILAILAIGALNWVGPTKGSTIAAVIALLAALSAGVLLIFAVPSLKNMQLVMPSGGLLGNWSMFVGVVLALSGVETVANMTGIMVNPVEKTSRRAILPVMLEVALITFLLGLAMNAIPGLTGHTEDMLRTMGNHYVGNWFGGLISILFGFALLSAGNTAISGLVNIQFILAKDGELPPIFAKLNRYGMPIMSLVVAVVVPIVVLLVERDFVKLAALYAIGVVGAITVNLWATATNFRLDLKKRERILLGIAVVIMAIIEITIAFEKRNALLFVMTVFAAGLSLRYIAKKVVPPPIMVEVPSVEVLTVSEAQHLASLYSSSTLVAVRMVNLKLLEEAALRTKGLGENAVYLCYVEEGPDTGELPTMLEPSAESIDILVKAHQEFEKRGITAIPIWQFGNNPGRLISLAARELGVSTVMVGITRRSALTNFVRGDIIRTLAKFLPSDCRLVISG